MVVILGRKIENIVIHCSDSEWGDAEEIDSWHKARGWKGIGYHYVVLNEYPTYVRWKARQGILDSIGAIEKGRPDDQDTFLDNNEIGAHVLGMNSTSIGICLIGKHDFHARQKWATAILCARLLGFYDLKVSDIIGHYETPSGKEQGKTCPNFNMGMFRALVRIALPLAMVQDSNAPTR